VSIFSFKHLGYLIPTVTGTWHAGFIVIISTEVYYPSLYYNK